MRSPAEHREYMQELVREGQEDAFVLWNDKVHSPEATIDDIRKFNEFAAKVTGIEAEKKVDPNANLPIFQFTFLNGGVEAKMVQPEPPPAIEAEVKEIWPFANSKPPAEQVEVERAEPPEDDDLTAVLDDMLKDF